jgi:hypothetical protein
MPGVLAAMTPYYEQDGIVIYHGDCRDVLPLLNQVDVIITDPVWPNAIDELAGSDDPEGLLRAAAMHFPRLANRAVIHLGCDSDPRILSAMPSEMPFFRACWLEYVRPHYKGRLLYGSDVAYAFGTPPPSEKGAHVIPGRFIQTNQSDGRNDHPCPRRYEHVRWLVRWFARGTVLDPFMGSGTTIKAAKELGLPAVGIEIEERHIDIAIRRLQQSVMALEIPA